jgi:hypothetical protein
MSQVTLRHGRCPFCSNEVTEYVPDTSVLKESDPTPQLGCTGCLAFLEDGVWHESSDEAWFKKFKPKDGRPFPTYQEGHKEFLTENHIPESVKVNNNPALLEALRIIRVFQKQDQREIAEVNDIQSAKNDAFNMALALHEFECFEVAGVMSETDTGREMTLKMIDMFHEGITKTLYTVVQDYELFLRDA